MRRVVSLSAVLLAACSSAAPTPAPSPATAPAAPATAARGATPAPAPAPAPAALNAVGTYSFATEVNGTPVAGTLVVTRANNVWGGKLTSDVFPEIPVTGVVVEGQTMKIAAESPNGSVSIIMNFSGNDYTGTWELGGLTGPVSGKRIS
jgi:hypothetical protein